MGRVIIFILSLIISTSLFAEQSVYSDTDFVDSSTIAKKNSREIFMLKSKINQLKEQIEGLKSIINGQADEISQLKQRDNSNLENIINQLSQRVAKLESRPAEVVKEKVVEKVNVEKNREITQEKKEPKNKDVKEKPKNSDEVYKDSVLNFTKNRLTKAENGFKILLKRGYKKASTEFYLGEIAYKKGKYKNAIEYYQESATLNDKASYMDKLLYHTAVSLDKKGKKQEAKIFLKAVIEGYEDSKIKGKAKKYLDKL